jgi:hypothetical protein
MTSLSVVVEDYVWVSIGNAMKAKQSKAKHTTPLEPTPLV